MLEKKLLMDAAAIMRAIRRIAHEIIERNKGLQDIILIGIKTRGGRLARRLAAELFKIEGKQIEVYELDITAYRDDEKKIIENKLNEITEMAIDDRKIILVDDVLFTGRTVRSALNALIEIGRAKEIQLATLIDRGHRELPIKANYIGKNVPTSLQEAVAVKLEEIDGEDKVVINEI